MNWEMVELVAKAASEDLKWVKVISLRLEFGEDAAEVHIGWGDFRRLFAGRTADVERTSSFETLKISLPVGDYGDYHYTVVAIRKIPDVVMESVTV